MLARLKYDVLQIAKFVIYNVIEWWLYFREMDEIELRRSPIFKEHAYRFMRVVDDLVDSMDQPKTHIQQNLMMLGAKHATFEGFRIEYFEAYSKSLIDVWEYTIGEEFIPEVRESWTEFFDYLVKYMCQGYNVFINETDVTCNGDDHFRFEWCSRDQMYNVKNSHVTCNGDDHISDSNDAHINIKCIIYKPVVISLLNSFLFRLSVPTMQMQFASWHLLHIFYSCHRATFTNYSLNS